MFAFDVRAIATLTVCAQLLTVLAAGPFEMVLVDGRNVTTRAVTQWKAEGFKGVAVVLEESGSERALTEMARRVSEGGLDLYYWIEMARNPEMANKNPRWMAALGAHDDWQKNFPKFPEPGVGEVAKAFPWVPIGYREGFDAHLARIERLLKRVPAGWRGVLLNDLQGGPSSCGCGNVQCRWALDYQVSATATKLEGYDVPARFLAEVRKRVGERIVIPVWTTECAEVDLPAKQRAGQPGTGFCGNVGCAHSACAEVFAAQWSFLASSAPIGVLATHSALHRTQPEFGGGVGWFTNAIAYINQTLLAHHSEAVSADRLWVVIDGTDRSDEGKAREIASKAGVGGLVSARIKIDQSYEPKMIRTN